jgi:hypothetical protein
MGGAFHKGIQFCQVACPDQSFFDFRWRHSETLQTISQFRLNGLIEELGIGILKDQSGVAKQFTDRVLACIEPVHKDPSGQPPMMKMGDQSDTGAAKG